MATLKSGIDATHCVIPGEDPDEFRRFASGLTLTCCPADACEQFLVDQMIVNGWRLRRLRKTEPQVRISCETAGRAITLRRLRRLISSVQRSYDRAAADLQRLQARRGTNRVPLLYYVQ